MMTRIVGCVAGLLWLCTSSARARAVEVTGNFAVVQSTATTGPCHSDGAPAPQRVPPTGTPR